MRFPGYEIEIDRNIYANDGGADADNRLSGRLG